MNTFGLTHAYTPIDTRTQTHTNVIWDGSSAEYAYPLYPYFAIKYICVFF